MRRFLVLVATAVALAFPVAVSADTIDGGEPPPANTLGGMSVANGGTSLIGRVVVAVDAEITCQPKPPSEYPIRSGWEDASLRVWIRQASGRSVAAGFSEIFFDGETVCDGSPHMITASVSADPSGPPFKRGSAVLAIAGSASYFVFNEETWEDSFQRASASTGWQRVRLR
jgi:hypothetical protein